MFAGVRNYEYSTIFSVVGVEVPCAMSMRPARHYEMLDCGEINRWHNLAKFNCHGLFCVIEEANIRVLQQGENLRGWEMENIQY